MLMDDKANLASFFISYLHPTSLGSQGLQLESSETLINSNVASLNKKHAYCVHNKLQGCQ